MTLMHLTGRFCSLARASGDNIEPFDGPNQFARLGERRRAMWCIGQAVQRRRRADLVHRRPAYQAFWTSLRSPCGRPGPRRRSRLASRPDKPVKWFNIGARCSTDRHCHLTANECLPHFKHDKCPCPPNFRRSDVHFPLFPCPTGWTGTGAPRAPLSPPPHDRRKQHAARHVTRDTDRRANHGTRR